MLHLYNQTPLEDLMERLYREKGFLTPADLEIENVAYRFNVKLKYMPGAPDRALWTEKNSVIFLNPDHPLEMLREIFFHELCHPLRHYGSQSNMNNDSFRELQEAQAAHFQLYAAMPFFIMRHSDLPESEQELIELLSVTFKLSNSFVIRRINQIKRRIYQGKSDEEHRRFMESLYPKAPPYSDETNAILDQLHKLKQKRKGATL